MNTKFSTSRRIKRMFVNILSIVVMLAMAFPVTGNVSAEEPFFLESSHDGAWGEVIASGCDANGWAVDPDDRFRDVRIQVFSDGVFVAESVADVPRGLPDELCPDGGCGFHVPLWGLIEAGVPHEISVKAYDLESDQWMDLGGTPKSLTCWGYPESSHDGAWGEVIASGCDANGWAVDPDDRFRDVQIQVLSDGVFVAETVADVPRGLPDELCPDGGCGFHVSLWGLIEAGVLHEISVKSYDPESNQWLDLGGTPKSLTCWGYPEGFHDGNEGMVDPNSCTASGWAVDPDDRDRDLRVQILADDHFVIETTANLLREDVGACIGGTCGYSVGLWDLISPDVEHQITAQAFDEETNTWMNLEATPKSLTCQTPPPPSPWLRAHPEWESVDGWYWPLGAELHLTIEDPNTITSPDLEMFKIVDVVSDPPENNSVWFEFAGIYDLKPGDVVTLTDGTTTRTLLVSILSITNVDVEADTVAGTAEPGTLVRLPIPGELFAPADDGTWFADFAALGLDLAPGMTVIAEAYDEDGDLTSFERYIPNTRFTVWPEMNFLEGYEWRDGAVVSISVTGKEVCSTEAVSSYPEWDPSNTFFSLNFPDGCTIGTGDLITLSSDSMNLVHQVQELAITEVNIDADTVTGTAAFDPEQYNLHTWIHGFDGSYIQLTAEEGAWLANFGSQGIDLQPGMGGRVELTDQASNSTAVEWRLPNPSLGVRANTDQVEGWEWTLGSTITVTVDDPATADNPDITQTAVVYEAPWNPGEFRFDLNLYGVIDIQPGFEVTASDGISTKTHIVSSLAFTEINIDMDTVTGTAAAGSNVDVWTCDNAGCYNSPTVVANDSGVWVADFATIFDIVRGIWVDSSVRDEDGDSTMYGMNVPNPYIEAAPFSDWIHAREWPLGTLMTLEIDDPSDGLGDVDYSETATMQQAPWNPNDPNDIVADFRWPDQFAPGPGYVLTMSGNGQSKTLTTSNLSMTSFDLDADTISGIGTPNALVQVCANVPDRCITRWVTAAEGSGNWTADYGVPGTGNDDPDTFDVQLGSNGWAAEYEADSDRTWFDWRIPNPRMVVFPEWEWFDGNDWPDGAIVNITVEGKPECATSKESWGYFFNGSFGEDCNVEIGDVVTFTDGETIRTHTVQNLAITKVNQEDNIVKGTADAGAEIHVWPHATGQEQLAVTNPQGKWNVDFTEFYDLMPGDGGRSEIRDEFGNATAVDWYISNPRIVASITEDWFYLQEFTPNTALNFSIYEGQDGKLTWKGAATTDGSGFSWIDSAGWDLAPGNYLIVKDGSATKDIVIEGFTFDLFDLSQGLLQGTVPGEAGRHVWVGIGLNDSWSTDVFTDADGNWTANYENPVPSDYQWVAAQIFDADGDATELRPDRIINIWVAAYTYDLPAGYWSEEQHSYHFEAAWNGGSETTNEIFFNVSDEAPSYDGYVLLRPGAVRAAPDCSAIDEIRADQLTRFLTGYVTDYAMTYSEAQEYFDSLTASAVWDGGPPQTLTGHEIIPFNLDDWVQYVCRFTADIILDNQPDWVDSGITVTAGQTFTIEAFGLMNPCSDTYPNGATYCIFYTPLGAEWDVPYENDFGIFPGPGLHFMTLLGRIGDGTPFEVGAGGTFTAEQTGTLWFTPNDNLRTDNQGAYSVLVWLEP